VINLINKLNRINIRTGLGLFSLGLVLFMVLELLLFPQLERFRYGSIADGYIPYYKLEKLESSLIDNDFIKADNETAAIVFKAIGKEKVRKVGRLDAANFSCQYLLKLENVWGRASKGKFGFNTQSEVLSKWKSERDFNKLEANFRDVVGWDKDKNVSNIYPQGYFPREMYRQDFVVPAFSQRIAECQKDK
jgi:GUN4-like